MTKEERREYNKRYREENRDRLNKLRNEWRKKNGKTQKPKTCPTCKKEFMPKKRSAKYCSRTCQCEAWRRKRGQAVATKKVREVWTPTKDTAQQVVIAIKRRNQSIESLAEDYCVTPDQMGRFIEHIVKTGMFKKYWNYENPLGLSTSYKDSHYA